MFSGNREELREYYFLVWEKYQASQPLEPLEQQILHVILEHPEYHRIFEQPDRYKHQDFDGETNPFLHMALHLAIREQVATNRPAGIEAIYQQYLKTYQDPLTAEHQMLELLIDMIWDMQRNQSEFSEQEYVMKLREKVTGQAQSAANEEW